MATVPTYCIWPHSNKLIQLNNPIPDLRAIGTPTGLDVAWEKLLEHFQMSESKRLFGPGPSQEEVTVGREGRSEEDSGGGKDEMRGRKGRSEEDSGGEKVEVKGDNMKTKIDQMRAMKAKMEERKKKKEGKKRRQEEGRGAERCRPKMGIYKK